MIPLTSYLAALLDALPRRNEWVFRSPTASNGPLAEPRIAHTKALADEGRPHVSLHGLQRSFGTLCKWVEMPSGISAQIVGHKPSALAEKHYRRRPLDLLRMWHEKIEAWMLLQAGIDFPPARVTASSIKNSSVQDSGQLIKACLQLSNAGLGDVFLCCSLLFQRVKPLLKFAGWLTPCLPSAIGYNRCLFA